MTDIAIPLKPCATIGDTLGRKRRSVELALGEVTVDVARRRLPRGCARCATRRAASFEQLIDLCGIDYSDYRDRPVGRPRFCVVSHLLSVSHNQRLRLRCCARRRPSGGGLADRIWTAANWFEREAFDLYGIVFEGHPTCAASSPTTASSAIRSARTSRCRPRRNALRRGAERVVYQPVTIEPREITPRVIREDNYGGPATEHG